MAMPGAISTNSDATCGTGKYPRHVVQMCAASCGCNESRNTYARSWVCAMAGARLAWCEQSSNPLQCRLMSVIRSWARTDIGRKRKHNEDAFLTDDALGLYVVADGMGGHAAGEVASAQAVKSIREALEGGRPLLESFAKAPTVEGREHVAQLMERAILKACADIHAIASGDTGKRGMGTTVVALLAAGKKAVVGHVGDSRVYLFRNGRAHQLTEDHTIIQEQLKRGLITREQVATAENRNVITRAVGIQASVAVDSLGTDLLPGDLFVLCSDGLHGYLDDAELPQLFAQEREKLPDLLVDLALQRGGKDN